MTKTARWALGFALLIGLVLCALPLFGTIGPESALALGLVLSPWASGLAARLALNAREKKRRTGPLLADAIAASWTLVALPVLILAINALRMKTCDPWGGLSFIVLGPLASVTLASLLGVCVASFMRSPKLAITLSVLVPIAAIGSALYDFVTTPGIYAFGHFFGYFPGTFYDRRIEIPDAWLTHRALSLVIAFGLWALLGGARNAQTGLANKARLLKHPVLCLFAIAAAALSVLGARNAYKLGHRTSSRHIESSLGLVIEGRRCRAVVPRELDLTEAHRLAEDCAFRIDQIERTLGVRERQQITAFFFRSPQEKRVLMGAARVYIAKPWRREAYLQLSEFPHPVLAHELAHVVARNTASGPFGVPGKLGGLIPEPTLVEGTAVALEPAARDELTPHQWAKAAYLTHVAPELRALLGPRFFGANQQLAYTLAGSFLRFVLETRGAAAVRAIYRTNDVEGVLKKPFPALEEEWRRMLAEVPLPPSSEALARLRFERGSVFSQVCPHEIERLEHELSASLSAGDLEGAAETCREVLAIDPAETGTRATLVGTLARAGMLERAQAELKKLEGPPKAPAPTVARARAALADASFMRGDYAAAERAYRELLREPQPDAELRQLEVKLLALDAGEPTRSLLGELLIGRLGRPTDPRTAMHLIRLLYPARKDGLAYYLEARQLAAAGRHDLAYPLFAEALARGLSTRRLRVEALRLRGLSAFDVGALDDAQQTYTELSRLEDASLAEQLEAQDFLARIAFRRTGS